MQRITRLIAPTSAPARRGARLAGALVLACGAVIALQVGAGPKGVHLHVESSGRNGNAPDTRVVTDTSGNVTREYRAQVGKNGRLAETYTENGVAKPITADTRRWLADVSRIAPPPPPPAPPHAPAAPPAPPPPPASAVPAPPAPPAPPPYDPDRKASAATPIAPVTPPAPATRATPVTPATPTTPRTPNAIPAAHAMPAPVAFVPPPPPPAPPSITDSSEFKALMRQVVGDRGVQAALGTPVAVTGREISGGMSIDDDRGHADMRMTLRGPKGESRVHVVAQRSDGAWATETVNVEGPSR